MQKQITPTERRDLELFLKLFGNFDAEACEFYDFPDLLIQGSGPLIGVEHTRIFRNNDNLPAGRQLLPQERIQHQITERAQAMFRKNSPLFLYLTVSFSDPSDYRIRDIPIISDELALSVSQSISLLGAQAHSDVDILIDDWMLQSRGHPFPRGVSSFHFKIQKNPAYELWAPAYGYVVPILSIAHISETIERKEAHIGKYRSRCENIWLLIVTDTGLPSSHYDVPRDVIDNRYDSSFDRLFLMTCFHCALSELTLRGSKSARATTP
jgi:hypothetical protein